MVDAAVALANPPGNLSPFEDVDVLRAAIEIPNAAGGLREAMQFEPREFHHDDEVTIVLRCRVKKVRFDEVRDKNDEEGGILGLVRVHVLDAQAATFIEDDVVDRALEDQALRIQRAKDSAAGVARLPTDEELYTAHTLGEHADGLVEGCVECEREREALDAE